MKRTICLLLSLLMVIGLLAGCTSTSDTTETDAAEATDAVEETEAAEEETDAAEATDAEEETEDDDMPVAEGVDGLTIGVCIYDFSDNFMTSYRTELERYLAGGGADVQLVDGKNDQAEQTNQIQNFITQGVDVLIINLVQPSSAETVTNLCNDAGIPVVFINREPDESEEERWVDEGILATYVGADARQSGTFQGEIVAALDSNGDLDGDGVISYAMIEGDPENIDAQYRTEYSIMALEDAGLTVNELFDQRGDWDQAKGQELAANALSANGEALEVIFCNNDAMALGALQAIEAAGRTVGEDIYLLGVDALPDALEAIIEGRMTGTVFNDHFSQARQTGDCAAMFAAGETVEATYVIDYVKVTLDNAQEILDMVS